MTLYLRVLGLSNIFNHLQKTCYIPRGREFGVLEVSWKASSISLVARHNVLRSEFLTRVIRIVLAYSSVFSGCTNELESQTKFQKETVVTEITHQYGTKS